MTHSYQLTGMTCSSCEQKVRSSLLELEEVEEVKVSKEEANAQITVSKDIPLSKLQTQLAKLGDKYAIRPLHTLKSVDQTASWISTYKPVLLIFIYLFSITGLIEFTSESLDIGRWMRHFMAGFFITFSFFKLLNLKGFKESYLMYDVIARRFPFWGYIYAFAELGLGIAFLINFYPVLTYLVTIILMSVSIIGVLQTVLNKKAIKCACLGDVFNLPMSTVTIIEDGLMIVMATIMLMIAI